MSVGWNRRNPAWAARLSNRLAALVSRVGSPSQYSGRPMATMTSRMRAGDQGPLELDALELVVVVVRLAVGRHLDLGAGGHAAPLDVGDDEDGPARPTRTMAKAIPSFCGVDTAPIIGGSLGSRMRSGTAGPATSGDAHPATLLPSPNRGPDAMPTRAVGTCQSRHVAMRALLALAGGVGADRRADVDGLGVDRDDPAGRR